MTVNRNTASELLRAVQTGSSAGLEIGRAGHTHDRLYGVTVGVLIASILAVVSTSTPLGNPG